MQKSHTISKRLCMTELIASHTLHRAEQHYEADAGGIHAAFGFVVSGSVTLSSMGKTVVAHAGELFYLPEGVRYRSIFTGEPDIEYYTLHIVTAKREIRPTDRIYAMQVVDALSTPATGTSFAEIYRLFASDDRINKIRAIGLYYSFYADVLPLLVEEEPIKQHDALITAVNYIEGHFSENFDISELAAIAHVSESRLFHLFREKLNTTPIAYRNEVRIERAAHALRSGERSVEEIAEDCGFHSAAYFRRIFRQDTGLSPTEYRKRSKS